MCTSGAARACEQVASSLITQHTTTPCTDSTITVGDNLNVCSPTLSKCEDHYTESVSLDQYIMTGPGPVLIIEFRALEDTTHPSAP